MYPVRYICLVITNDSSNPQGLTQVISQCVWDTIMHVWLDYHCGESQPEEHWQHRGDPFRQPVELGESSLMYTFVD
jgi:hypothetical protein